MLLRDVFCFAVFTLTVTAAAARPEESTTNLNNSEKHEKKLRKRETIFIDGYPETPYRPNKVVYRRVSRQRYEAPSKYRSKRPKYVSANTSRRPTKKYKDKPVPKQTKPTSSYNKRPRPARYGPPKNSHLKTKYGPPKTRPQGSFVPPETMGYGEPPATLNIKQNYGEPPTDSYGAPLSQTEDHYPAQGFSYNQQQQLYPYNDQSKPQWNYEKEQGYPDDSNFAYTQNVDTYAPGKHLIGAQISGDIPMSYNEEESEPSVFNGNFQTHWRDDFKRKPYSYESIKPVPRKVSKLKHIVGGQYAEPPARYVHNFEPSVPNYSEDNRFKNINDYVDPEETGSSLVSSYINYKNSNMAFSPQNLNDAFSILD